MTFVRLHVRAQVAYSAVGATTAVVFAMKAVYVEFGVFGCKCGRAFGVLLGFG